MSQIKIKNKKNKIEFYFETLFSVPFLVLKCDSNSTTAAKGTRHETRLPRRNITTKNGTQRHTHTVEQQVKHATKTHTA
jgi:hypothetical protein